MKKTIIFLILLIFPFFLTAQEEITIARRMKVLVVDFESPASENSLLSGKTLSSEIERSILDSKVFLEKVIVLERNSVTVSLAGFRIDDMLGMIKRGEELGAEALLAGRITRSSNGSYSVLIQMIDVQKKNIPSSRRILNFAEVKDVEDKADSVILAVKKLVQTLETGNFPRVDIITPNFDVVSINQINKDNFPELKLSISVVNSRGEPVTIPPDLFEVRENGNMVLATVERSKSSESIYTPITLLLAIDKSPSMIEELDGRKTGMPFKRAKSAALDFISKLSPQDRVKLVAFDQKAVELGGYTNDKKWYIDRLNEISVGIGTGLYNVLRYCVQDMEKIKGEKAVILLTDGKNDVRGAPPEIAAVTLNDGLDLAQNLSIPVYTIGFGGADEKVLGEIATKTHSIFFKAISSEKLRDLYMKLHKIIENQYIITYKSLADRSGKVSVSLNVKEDERMFYLSPEEQKKVDELKKNKVLDQEMGKINLQKKELEAVKQNVEKEKLTLEAQKKDLNNLQEQVDRGKKELEKEKEELKKLKADMDKGQKELGDRQNTIDLKEKEISEKETSLASKETSLSNLETALNAKQKDVSAREEQIKKENQRIESQKQQILQIQENIRKADTEILDFLKQKYEYINDEKEKLEKLKTSQSESNL